VFDKRLDAILTGVSRWETWICNRWHDWFAIRLTVSQDVSSSHDTVLAIQKTCSFANWPGYFFAQLLENIILLLVKLAGRRLLAPSGQPFHCNGVQKMDTL
jgi:hypothetical protein